VQRAVIAALALIAPAFATAALAQNDGPFPGAQPSGSAINLLPALPRPWAPRRLKIEGTSLDVPNDPDDSEVDDPGRRRAARRGTGGSLRSRRRRFRSRTDGL